MTFEIVGVSWTNQNAQLALNFKQLFFIIVDIIVDYILAERGPASLSMWARAM
jgi:hypothetical protein